MVSMIKDMFGRKKLRCIAAVLAVCALVAFVFVYSFVAHGDPDAAKDAATTSTSTEAEDTVEPQNLAEIETVLDIAIDDETGDPDENLGIAVQSDEPAIKPTWVIASDDNLITFDPVNDANATKATIAGNANITVNLAGNPNYTLVINGEVSGDITVPTGTTLSVAGSGTITGAITVSSGATLNLADAVEATGDIAIPGSATTTMAVNGKVSGAITVPENATLNLSGNGEVTGAVTISSGATLNVANDCTMSGAITVPENATANLVINGEAKGTVKVSSSATLNLAGSGKIAGTYTVPGNAKLNLVKIGDTESALAVPSGARLDVITGEQGEGGKQLAGVITVSENPERTFVIDGEATTDIDVSKGATLNLQGSGKLTGSGTRSVVLVDGGNSKLCVGAPEDVGKDPEKCLTITGGTGSPLVHDDIFAVHDKYGTKREPNATTGGAILVRWDSKDAYNSNAKEFPFNDQHSATLVINNVKITGNVAQGGGGIYIDRSCRFKMKDGLIEGNCTAKGNGGSAHEGGGIVIAGAGFIEKGQIKDNRTVTTVDWGGGGIFIESKGKLFFGVAKATWDDVTNTSPVLITGNTANGLGGGISGCPHADTSIGDLGGDYNNGVAVYKNTAYGTTCPNNKYLWNNNGLGDYRFFTSQGGPAKSTNNIVTYSQDYYCTKTSVIGTQGFETTEGYSWMGVFTQDGTNFGNQPIGGDSQDFSQGNTSLGLTACWPKDETSFTSEFKVVISGNTSTTHGGGIGCNGTLTVGPSPAAPRVVNTTWGLSFNKELVSLNNGVSVDTPRGEFTFELYEGYDYEKEDCKDPVTDKSGNPVTAQNDANGNIVFILDSYCPTTVGESETYEFYAKEVEKAATYASGAIDFDKTIRKVEVKVKLIETSASCTAWSVTTQRPEIVEYKYYTMDSNQNWVLDSGDQNAGKTFINKFRPHGQFDLIANKAYYGADVNSVKGGFNFTMERLDAAGITETESGKIKYSAKSSSDNDEEAEETETDDEKETYKGVLGDFNSDGKAPIEFKAPLDDVGTFWYMVTEDEAEGVITDSRVYLVKVKSDMKKEIISVDDSLDINVEAIYYADELLDDKTEFTRLEKDGAQVEFANFDAGGQSMRLHSYAVYAASNEPVEQECFVDPKIIKDLEGRTLKEGEFNFKLIQLATDANDKVDWSVTQGETISETSNDRYGMVDFDAANNLSGDLDNPSCLAYKSPGTYYYRVVEATEPADPSINYSTQIITFTTVIERNDQGQLVCTDMYYGHVENGKNVRYEESENPQWHPTITNTAKGMDLRVRKTSALDRENGLEGATYGLYAVNEGAQSDIFLGEAVSDADGWMTFKDVSLKEGTLYYFKERLAPAGHTVSEFRSGLFYLVEDPNDPNSYVMRYTDSKTELEQAQADASANANAGIATMALDDEEGAADVSDNGRLLYTYARDGGVFDEATTVEFNKLDTRTHEWVEGARLAIIEKKSGQTVNEWTSGNASERLEGKLNVDTTYILRELSAPEGYAKADDVEFIIGEYGAVTLLSGTSNGNAEIQDSTITLYDTMLDVTRTVTEERVTTDDGGSGDDVINIGGMPVRTGDLLKFGGLLAVALVAILGLIIFSRFKHKPQHSRKR